MQAMRIHVGDEKIQKIIKPNQKILLIRPNLFVSYKITVAV